MLRKFFSWNRAVCNRIGDHLPHARAHLYFKYPTAIEQLLRDQRNFVLLDVGAGKSCPFASALHSNRGLKVIGVDISAAEIRDNPDLDYKLVADVVSQLPFADASVDAIVSRSVLEHLTNVEGFIREAARVLKPGGAFIHFFPNKFAPFAVINQLLPKRLSRGALHLFWEDSRGICGFPAVYNRCTPRAMERMLRAHGFQPTVRVSYYQSFYYGFFLPFYLLSVAYEMLVWVLRFRALSAFLLVSAKKQ